MKIERIENIKVLNDDIVTLKQTGNIFEMRFMTKSVNNHIQKIDKDNYVYIETGEVKKYNHQKCNRSENVQSTRKSFEKLRDILNANIKNPSHCLFVTLTYKENMTDNNKLYDDFRKFNMRFMTYCNKNKIHKPEYINVVEPQGRGAWHCHVIYIFNKKAPYIPNNDISDIWKKGFTSTRKLQGNVDNIGVYLTAYLTDVEFNEIPDISLLDDISKKDIKTVELVDKNGNKTSKSYIKGLRLKMYPKGMNIFRHSKGIKQPIITKCTKSEAMNIIGCATKTYEKTLKLTDDLGFETNKINYQYFNKK